MALNDFLALGGRRQDLLQEAASIKAKTEKLPLDGELAKEIMEGFWKSLFDLSAVGPRLALKHDGTKVVDIFLDPTQYEVSYTDPYQHCQFSVAGPEVSTAGLNGSPLVKWMVAVKSRVDALKADRSR